MLLLIKIALRSLFKARNFVFLNVFGLSITITAIFIIYSYLSSEKQADFNFANKDTTYRIVRHSEKSNLRTSSSYLPAPFRTIISGNLDLPEHLITRVFQDDELISYKDKVFFESNVLYVDENFLGVLEQPLRLGDSSSALDAPDAVVLSEKVAKKYFADEQPIGQTIETRSIMTQK